MAVRPSRMSTLARRAAPGLVVLLLLLGAWQYAATKGSSANYSFPRPALVGAALVQLAREGHLGTSLVATLRRLAYGFGISVLIGGTLAFFMARFAIVRAGVKPYLLGLQSLPSIAWVPLAIVWFGYSEKALIFVTVIGSIFAVAIAFTDALGSVRPAPVLAARNMGAHGIGLILRVQVPAALPPLVGGAKQCWSFAWRSLVGAEIIFATVGLGFLLNQGREFLDIPQVFAVMLMTLLVGLLFEVLVFSNVERAIARRWGHGVGQQPAPRA